MCACVCVRRCVCVLEVHRSKLLRTRRVILDSLSILSFSTCVCVSVCLSVCVYVSVCMGVREKEKEKE